MVNTTDEGGPTSCTVAFRNESNTNINVSVRSQENRWANQVFDEIDEQLARTFTSSWIYFQKGKGTFVFFLGMMMGVATILSLSTGNLATRMRSLFVDPSEAEIMIKNARWGRVFTFDISSFLKASRLIPSHLFWAREISVLLASSNDLRQLAVPLGMGLFQTFKIVQPPRSVQAVQPVQSLRSVQIVKRRTGFTFKPSRTDSEGELPRFGNSRNVEWRRWSISSVGSSSFET